MSSTLASWEDTQGWRLNAGTGAGGQSPFFQNIVSYVDMISDAVVDQWCSLPRKPHYPGSNPGNIDLCQYVKNVCLIHHSYLVCFCACWPSQHTFKIQDTWNPLLAKIGTIQRRLAWPLRKDDKHKSRSGSHLSDAHEMQVGQRQGVTVGPRASPEVAETCRDTLKVLTS